MRTMVLVLVFTSGCATTRFPESWETFPVLIYQVPLPGFYQTSFRGDLKIDLKLYIAKDSSVQEVIFLSSNIDPTWETSAIQEIRKWRFLPATQNGIPVSVWIRQSIIIRPEKPLKMFLSEISCANRREADSIYSLLTRGENFDSLEQTVLSAPSREQNGNLGEVDVRTYPFHIQKELENLNIGDITKPLPLGQFFTIFKRFSGGTEQKTE